MNLDKDHGSVFNSQLNLKVSSVTSEVITPSLNTGKLSVRSYKHRRRNASENYIPENNLSTNHTDENYLEIKSTSYSSRANTYTKATFKCFFYSKDLELNFDEPLENNFFEIPKIDNDIISLTIKPLYDKVKVNRPIEVPCIISLKSCNENLGLIEKNRLGQDLVFVIDNSGSMKGYELDLVKTTIKFVITLLNYHDRVSIVCFNQKASIYCPLILMTEQGKDVLIKILNSLDAEGNTNIESGSELHCTCLLIGQ